MRIESSFTDVSPSDSDFCTSFSEIFSSKCSLACNEEQLKANK